MLRDGNYHHDRDTDITTDTELFEGRIFIVLSDMAYLFVYDTVLSESEVLKNYSVINSVLSERGIGIGQ